MTEDQKRILIETICDDLCRWPDIYDDADRMHEEKCASCPLNILTEDSR